MKNNYRYIDPDGVYTDPNTGVLRNLGNITDHDALVFAETAATSRRAKKLRLILIVYQTSRLSSRYFKSLL